MRFRKKPIVIEAILWTGTNIEEAEAFCGNALSWSADGKPLIHTLEGGMFAKAGDYLIKGVEGEFYPCKPSVFETTYEPVL